MTTSRGARLLALTLAVALLPVEEAPAWPVSLMESRVSSNCRLSAALLSGSSAPRLLIRAVLSNRFGGKTLSGV